MSSAIFTSHGSGDLPPCLSAYALKGQTARDECLTEDGQIRPVWKAFIDHIETIGAPALAATFARANGHLASAGVVHRVYGDAEGVRPWPLSPMPILISASEWAALAAGVAERASLINDVLCDAYDKAHHVSAGHVPAAFFAASPEYARPLVGAAHRDAQPLRFYAVDLARGPDGRWWVLSDRTQAPSGAGYALENRLAMARALPDLYRTLRIHRLAGFFQDFRSHLVGLKRNPASRIGLFSPGPMNETYFEHSYLARYLGFVLVEGEDLVVRDGEVFIRTIAGLKPCDVLWRRVDSDFTDPLALNARSRIGVPGLVDAAREGRVTLANAIGTGLAESRAWMAVLPALAERRLGRPLRLPTQATWWGIDADARNVIASRFEELVIGSAFGSPLPGIGTGFAPGVSLSNEDRTALLDRLATRGVDIVAQESISMSTTPVFEHGKLVPRPFVLRLFAAWNGSEWHVMPGGFARVSETNDPRAVSLQRGGRSADVWVISDKPVPQTTLLRSGETHTIRRSPGSLPSRAADNLFWLGRYVERTELTVRLARAALARYESNETGIYGLLAATLVSHGALDAFPPGSPPSPAELGKNVLVGSGLPQSISALAQAALQAASSIRDRFSPDAWRVLHDLVLHLQEPIVAFVPEIDADERMDQALQSLAAFAGLVQDNMNRLMGWRFLDLGRRIERAIGMARLIDRFAYDDPWACDALLDVGDSALTYRLRYVDMPERSAVIDLLMLDPANPRSVAFQIQRIVEDLSVLSEGAPVKMGNGAVAHAKALQASLIAADANSFDASLPRQIAEGLMVLSEEIARLHIRPDAAGALA